MKREERNDGVKVVVGSLVVIMETLNLSWEGIGERSCMGVGCPDRDIWMNG